VAADKAILINQTTDGAGGDKGNDDDFVISTSGLKPLFSQSDFIVRAKAQTYRSCLNVRKADPSLHSG
jgi:hypothetical protein